MLVMALNQAVMFGGVLGSILTKMIKGEVDRPTE